MKLRGRAPEKQAALMETSQWLTPPPFGFHGDRIGGGALAWLLQQMWPVQGWGGGVAPGREPWDVAEVGLGAGPCSHSCGGQL